MRPTALFLMIAGAPFLAGRTTAFLSRNHGRRCFLPATAITTTASRKAFSSNSTTAEQEGAAGVNDEEDKKKKRQNIAEADLIPPWSRDLLTSKRSKRNNAVRVRQHVNPLARRFQLQTILSEDWPNDVYEDCKTKPLFLDIGVGKGGFLLKLASERPQDYNYLGLEIRPLAVQFAKERLQNQNNTHYEAGRGHLDFVGCNANVDLERLLSLYSEASDDPKPLGFTSIQFPDPHFKERHKRRRVVTIELVNGLAQFMPAGATVFLQSDVQAVLDAMRETFREAPLYFQDQVEDISEYHPENMIGTPTEREISVLKQDLPVYRTVFIRTGKDFKKA